jgi:small subunit ribosomal protein S3
MGQKVSPIGFRTGIKIRGVTNRTVSGTPTSNVLNWKSRWYAKKKDFGKLLVEDHRIREHVKSQFYAAGIPRIEIERTIEHVVVYIFAARPGLIIGRKGQKVDGLKSELEEIARKKVDPKIIEVSKPELEAQLVAESVAEQLERRASFRRTVKKAADITMQAGAEGVKIQISGRLGGSEMARREKTSRGSIPLHTLKADISYGFATSRTNQGAIGVKCWIYRGDLIKKWEADHGPDAQTR